MKKTYFAVRIDVIQLSQNDIVRTSTQIDGEDYAIFHSSN